MWTRALLNLLILSLYLLVSVLAFPSHYVELICLISFRDLLLLLSEADNNLKIKIFYGVFAIYLSDFFIHCKNNAVYTKHCIWLIVKMIDLYVRKFDTIYYVLWVIGVLLSKYSDTHATVPKKRQKDGKLKKVLSNSLARSKKNRVPELLSNVWIYCWFP